MSERGDSRQAATTEVAQRAIPSWTTPRQSPLSLTLRAWAEPVADCVVAEKLGLRAQVSRLRLVLHRLRSRRWSRLFPKHTPAPTYDPHRIFRKGQTDGIMLSQW